jgi:hypothetical protein
MEPTMLSTKTKPQTTATSIPEIRPIRPIRGKENFASSPPPPLSL